MGARVKLFHRDHPNVVLFLTWFVGLPLGGAAYTAAAVVTVNWLFGGALNKSSGAGAGDWLAVAVLGAVLIGGMGLAAVGLERLPNNPRAKPTGYVGKFQRQDGSVVHATRMPDGLIALMTEEAPGTEPRYLGSASGRELARWTKIGAEPDPA